ncbi:phage tail tape measure protein [Pantoea sp. FN0302]|uniref:phage tail tape measure protein n=1 Tax=Pantoea sp. FN0302 TaxID=3418558 RepID=UPI003CE95618
MSDTNLRLQVVLNAVDKITRPFRNAQAGSKELAAALKASKDTLKSLNEQAGKIDGFRKTRSQLAITEKNLAGARQEAAALATQFAATNRPTAQQARLLEQAKNRASELQQKYNGLRLSVQRQREALNAAGIDTKQLSAAQRRLKTDAEAASGALERQQAALKKLGERQKKLNAIRAQRDRGMAARDRLAGGGTTIAATGVAMGAPVLAAVKGYADMEDAMKGVAKQVSGLRDNNGNRTAQFYDMQKAIKAASEQLPMENGAVDYAALVEGGARMGVTNPADSYENQKRDLLAFASTAAKASTAFELPADELAEGLGKIAGLYKIPTRNIEQLGDALNYLDDNAMSKGADIIDVLQRMGGVADRLDYRKAAALGSTFLSLGAAPEVAASAANAMVRELSIATMQGKSFMAGMDLLKLDPKKIEKQMTTDAMGTIQRVLEKVNALPQDKRLSAMTMLFGKEFGDDGAKLANNLPELRRQLQLTAGSAAYGSMQKESDINKDSVSAQWMLVKAGMANTLSGLGETLRPQLMEMMDMFKKVTGSVRRWVEENPQLAGTTMKIAAVAAIVTTALGVLGVAMAAVLGPFVMFRFGVRMLGGSAGSKMGAVLGGLGKAFEKLAPGIGLSAGGLKKLFGVFTGGEAGESLDVIGKIREALGSLGGGDDDDEGGVLDAFREGAMEKVKEKAQEAGGALVSNFRHPVQAVKALGSHIRGLATAPFAALGSALAGVRTALGVVGNGIVWLGRLMLANPILAVVGLIAMAALYIWQNWETLGPKFAALWVTIRDGAVGAWNTITTWISTKWNEITADLKALPARFQEAGAQMIDALMAGISQKWEALKSKLTSLNSYLPDWMKPDTASGNGTAGKPEALQKSGFAGLYDSGGFIPSGQFGIVGENGPEIVNGPARITSRRRTAALAATAALVMGSAAMPVAARPLHPMSLPVKPGATVKTVSAGSSPAPAVNIHAPITIVQQPGQSAQDVVAEVMRQLEAKERQAQARARSSYRDRGGFDE